MRDYYSGSTPVLSLPFGKLARGKHNLPSPCSELRYKKCECSSVVECILPKDKMGVRFSSLAHRTIAILLQGRVGAPVRFWYPAHKKAAV
jgi:hypothetical protein